MEPALHTDLTGLLDDVNRARTALERVRGSAPQARMSTLDARAHLLLALEAYADGLASQHCPLPYKLRDELRLHRQLAGL
jgi:hypothetical protein